MAVFSTRKALADLLERDSGDASIEIVEVYANRGETNRAFAWLQKAYVGRLPSVTDINSDPYLVGLRSDPRYKALLRKMHLPG